MNMFPAQQGNAEAIQVSAPPQQSNLGGAPPANSWHMQGTPPDYQQISMMQQSPYPSWQEQSPVQWPAQLMPDMHPSLKGPTWSRSGQSSWSSLRHKASGTGSRPGLPGFTLASLCLISGALLLLFVYFMSSTLPSPGGGQTATAPMGQGTSVVPTASAGVTSNTKASPTAAPSSTAYPGQQFIDNARTASAIDVNTAQPITSATSFRVKQRIFVTFSLHPRNSAGRVCLEWYVQDKQFSQYSFSVGAAPQSAYSYADASTPGSGSLKLYWSTAPTCANKVLAQQVQFTVTP